MRNVKTLAFAAVLSLMCHLGCGTSDESSSGWDVSVTVNDAAADTGDAPSPFPDAPPATDPLDVGPDAAAQTCSPDHLPADGDADSDGLLNSVDNCPCVANHNQRDTDADGVGDDCDNCPAAANFCQVDSNGDGVGDACAQPDRDHDRDGDGVPDWKDNCPDTPNASQADSDGDAVGDACDNCPLMANRGQEDSDGNGMGDACEGIDCNGISAAGGDACSCEVCDGVDDDCDGQIDEGCTLDCVPTPEVCDGADNDCDGQVDQGCPGAASTECPS